MAVNTHNEIIAEKLSDIEEDTLMKRPCKVVIIPYSGTLCFIFRHSNAKN